MSDHDNFGSFLSGVIIGGITGAVVALLLAPQSGDETRKLIKEKSIELHDKAATYADEILGEVSTKTNEFIDTTKKKASEVAEKGQVILESKKEKAPAAKKSTKPE